MFLKKKGGEMGGGGKGGGKEGEEPAGVVFEDAA